jgi:hypothetical protein
LKIIVYLLGPLCFGGSSNSCCISGGSIVLLVGPKFFGEFVVGHRV